MPPIPLLGAILLILTRPWPRWLQDRIFDTPLAYHTDGSVCRSRWCVDRNEQRHW